MSNVFNQINGVSGSGKCIIRNNMLMVFIIAAFFTFLLSPLYVFAQVEADVATAKGIQAQHEASIMALPGVIGIGIGSREEGGMEFVVLVDKDVPMPDLPSNLEGIPVVAEKISKIMIHNGGISCDPCHAEKFPMPVPMGTSTSTDQVVQLGPVCFVAVGTAGFKACDNASGKIGYVTNNHVGAAFGLGLCENGPPGLIEVHPGTVDANPVCTLSGTMPIGTLSKVVTINFPGPNLVDAAFVESSDQETSSAIRDIGTPTTTPGTPTLDKCVKKSGRTTGLTFGRITGVNLTIGVSDYCGGEAIFQDTFIYTPDVNCGLCENPPCSIISLVGDSGSAVLDLNNNIVGLHFAGNDTDGFAVTIQNVLSELNVSLDLLNCGGPPPPPPDVFQACDANGSGTITAADVTALINDLRNRAPAQGNADCNNSGTVTAADVTALINVLRGRTQPPPPQPPPQPPPPPPPSVCQSPPLNTDFSDIGVFFVDSINAVLIGITSDGAVIGIVLADIPDSGALLGLEGNVLSSTVCDITLGQVILDGMLSPILGASGQCRLEGNFTVFIIEDLFVADIPLGVDLRGECFDVVSLEASSESLNTLNKAMLDKLQQMAGRQITTEEKGLILDFHEDITQNQEE